MKLKNMTDAELIEALNNPKLSERKRLQIAIRLFRHERAWDRVMRMAENAGVDWPSPK